MKFLIVAAKTGGHVFPAATVSKKLINNDHQIILIGTGNKIEINAYEELNSKQYKLNIDGFRGKNVFIKIKVLFQIITNIFYLLKVIKEERIDAMIGFGGFISVPAGIACFIKGIPVFTHEQNSVMGSSNKLLSKFAVINFLGLKISNINNSIFSGIFEYIALHISLPKDTEAPCVIASDDDIAAAKAPAPTIPYSNPDSVR